MKKTLLILACLAGSFFSQGQTILRSVVGSCGASATSSTTTLNYTVGEAVVSYLTSGGSPTYKLSQGFQQRDSVPGSGSVRKIENNVFKSIFKLSPNPANQLVKINYEIETSGTVTYNVYNSFGQLCLSVDQGMCFSGFNENEIDLRSLAAGSYMIAVSYSNSSNLFFIKNLPLIIVK